MVKSVVATGRRMNGAEIFMSYGWAASNRTRRPAGEGVTSPFTKIARCWRISLLRCGSHRYGNAGAKVARGGAVTRGNHAAGLVGGRIDGGHGSQGVEAMQLLSAANP